MLHLYNPRIAVVDTEDIEVPVTSLRGARVDVDNRRAGRVVVVLCVLSLVAAIAVLTAAGIDKNAQISQLRAQGVAVEMTVTRCLGLLGGSGSNEAGYACRGTYSVGGLHYNEAIPGNVFRAPGSKVRAVTVLSDPELVSTASEVAGEHPSWRVFLFPTILFALLALTVGVLAKRNGRAAPRPLG